MSQFKLLVTDHDFDDLAVEREILEPAGVEIVALQARREEDLFEWALECDAVMNQYARVGAAFIARATRCKIIARYGVGVDIVDVEAATARGILVTNVRDYCTDEVADHAIALWLSLARGLPAYDRATHDGVWSWRSGAPLRRLSGQTMGIVSFGKIGQAIARRAQAFGVNVVAHDPYVADAVARDAGVELVDKPALLARSDIIVVQAPMTAETRHFLDEAALRAMKPSAYVVNTGRGPTIDNRALHDAIAAGWIAGAGLDDTEEEPAKRAGWSPASNALFALSNVIVTPHVAYYSEDSVLQARRVAAEEVRRVLMGETPRHPVNTIEGRNRHHHRNGDFHA